MKIFAKLFGKKPAPKEEQAVRLHLRLGGEWPGDGEAAKFHELQDRLIEAIEANHAGELDGDEFGQGECVIFMYGPSAEKLWAAIAPVLKNESLARGGVAVLRFGGVNCGSERRIKLGQ